MKRTLATLMTLSLVSGCVAYAPPAPESYPQGGPVTGEVSASVGIDVAAYPELDAIPGYPVYYAPNLDANYFFYDGSYWLYQGDNWYTSSWYNGPWAFVDPMAVPAFILRVPVRYYRRPPGYFRGWAYDAPPRWDQHWGHDWDAHRQGWDQWDREAVPAPAPLPLYQRDYSGNRYPRQASQQQELNRQHYRNEPSAPYENAQRYGSPSAQPGRAQEQNPWLHGNEPANQSAPQSGQPPQGYPWLKGPQRNESAPYSLPNPPAEQNRWGVEQHPNTPPAPSEQPGGQGKNPWLHPDERNTAAPVQPPGAEHGNPWLQGTQRHPAAPAAESGTREHGQWDGHRNDGSPPVKGVNEDHRQTTGSGSHETRHEGKAGEHDSHGAPDNGDDHERYQR